MNLNTGDYVFFSWTIEHSNEALSAVYPLSVELIHVTNLPVAKRSSLGVGSLKFLSIINIYEPFKECSSRDDNVSHIVIELVASMMFLTVQI
jgi:hypothetical protein